MGENFRMTENEGPVTQYQKQEVRQGTISGFEEDFRMTENEGPASMFQKQGPEKVG